VDRVEIIVKKARDLVSKMHDLRWGAFEVEFIKDLADIDGYHYRWDQVKKIEELWDRLIP